MRNPDITFMKPLPIRILNAINELSISEGIDCYIVGGYIRDYLLKRKTVDIDFAVSGDVFAIARKMADRMNGKYITLDEINAIARVILQIGKDQWQLDFSSLRGNIENDLKKRDLTVNAMAVAINSFNQSSISIIDPCGGYDDLRRGVLRAVTDTVFADDPARLLRTVRLSVELAFAVEKDTEDMISRSAILVKKVAGERVREDFLRIANHKNLHNSLRYLNRLNILSHLMPELDDMKQVEQPYEHCWDVFEHSIETVAAVEFILRENEWTHVGDELLKTAPWTEEIERHMDEAISFGCTRRQLLKLAALLHDVGKPYTKTVDQIGKTRFIGHSKLGADIANGILQRLRFSNKEIKLVEKLIYYHLRPVQMANTGMPSARAIYRFSKSAEDAVIDILLIALADYLATYGPRLQYQLWKQHTDLINYILLEQQTQKTKVLPKKLITGHDVMSNFGLTPGPFVGKLLNLVHEAQATGKVATRKQALSLMEKEILKREK